eukprot:jgi/Mesvir1/4538/Mv20143-RA.1
MVNLPFLTRKKFARSEAAAEAAAKCAPITLTLGNTNLNFENGTWTSDTAGLSIPEGADEREKKIRELQHQLKLKEKELAQRKVQQEEMNMLDFKYQLLLDMYTMRAMEELGDKKR